jgi:hypothetical protein
MEQSMESLRQELLAARANVQRQIDKLRARPYPIVMSRMPNGTLEPPILPIRTNGVMIDNYELVAKLTETLRDIDDCLAELGGEDPRAGDREKA